MNVFEVIGAVGAVSFCAGLVGALTGLGGGVVLVPALTLLLHVDLRYAVGASLVAVIATSSGAAAAYVREGYTNARVGMLLEVATSAGAIAGAFLAVRMPVEAISTVFGVVLLYSAWNSAMHKADSTRTAAADPLAVRLGLNGSYPSGGEMKSYTVQHVWGGFGVMGIAGLLSGMLGIGSGSLKVLAMDQVMGLPFKVSTTTSNFMIGVTAAASAGVYLGRGYIDPGLAMPVVLGVLAGAFTGAKVLPRARSATLRIGFSVVVAVMALEMIWKAVSK